MMRAAQYFLQIICMDTVMIRSKCVDEIKEFFFDHQNKSTIIPYHAQNQSTSFNGLKSTLVYFPLCSFIAVVASSTSGLVAVPSMGRRALLTTGPCSSKGGLSSLIASFGDSSVFPSAVQVRKHVQAYDVIRLGECVCAALMTDCHSRY